MWSTANRLSSRSQPLVLFYASFNAIRSHLLRTIKYNCLIVAAILLINDQITSTLASSFSIIGIDHLTCNDKKRKTILLEITLLNWILEETASHMII